MKKLNIVLYHPSIPQNTGNIMRSCVGFNAKLHLIKPLGFDLEGKKVKRSVLDYMKNLEMEVYEDYSDFLSKNTGNFYFLTRYGKKSPSKIKFSSEEPSYIFFGNEHYGIDYDILSSQLDKCYRIPTTDKVRSLNLSNCAAVLMFLASEQINDSEVLNHEPDIYKGENFLEDYNDDDSN